jgi:hypothetical protein
VPDGGFLGGDAGPVEDTVRPEGEPVFNKRRPCVFGNDRRAEGFIKAKPAANAPVGVFPVKRREKGKRAGSQGVEDGLFFEGNAGGGEATVCPGGKAVGRRFGFHGTIRSVRFGATVAGRCGAVKRGLRQGNEGPSGRTASALPARGSEGARCEMGSWPRTGLRGRQKGARGSTLRATECAPVGAVV